MTGGTTRAGLELMHGDVTREVIGAYYEVYNALGAGFLEALYQRAMGLALRSRGVSYKREVPMTVRFMGEIIGEYRADLVVANAVIVETKAVDKLASIHDVQLINYLKATGITVGLILNFGPKAEFRRLALSSPQGGSAIIRASSA